MPPHLHPRSRMTSSLFATTVFVSFFVVGLPHLLPCPRPTTQRMDGEMSVDENGRPRIRRRRKTTTSASTPLLQEREEENSQPALTVAKGSTGAETKAGAVVVQFDVDKEDMGTETKPRECPIPKPGGIIGSVLGLGKREGGSFSGPRNPGLPPSDTGESR